MPSFVTHLESALDGAMLPAGQVQTMHRDRPLWVRYDLGAVAGALDKAMLAAREPTMWRYRELLPVGDEIDPVSLGEGMTPLLPCPRLGGAFGLRDVWIKDESQLPTGSFKSRGMAMAITMADHFGIRRVAVPTNGNAGGAAAAYAARAGIEAFVFMPQDTPAINAYECRLAGARTFFVNGLIGDCGRVVRDGCEPMGWFDLSTLKEPYRIEGKKTMGLELAEQFNWRLPDVILYPTGGGTGLIGMWKAFNELAHLGWLGRGDGEDRPRLPRMVAVQSDGCCPIVRAFESGERFAAPFPSPATVAAGIRVPSAVGDFMMLDALRESGGAAVAVDDARILHWMRLAAEREGVSVCPEAAACVGALEVLAGRGWIKPHDRVVLFNTAAAQKYPDAIAVDIPLLTDDERSNWSRIEAG